MKSRERVARALEHEEVDIIPYTDGFTTSESAQFFLGKRYVEADGLEKTIFIARLFNCDIVNLPAAGYPGGLGVFGEMLYEGEDHAIAKNPYGGLLYWRKKPYFAKVLYAPVQSKEDLANLEKPDVDDFRSKIRSLAKEARRLHDLDYFVISEIKGPFTSPWMFLRGLTNFLVDIVRDPEFAKRLIRFSFEPLIELAEVVVEEAGVDAMYVTGDYADGQGPFFSPGKYRELFRPWDEEVVKRIHKRGVKVCRHSHGNIMPLLSDLIDVGYDWLDPLDPADKIVLSEVKQRYGDKVTLVGGITKNIGTMSKDELRGHVEEVVETLGPTGFILKSAGGVSSEMSLESFNYYRYVIDRARKL